MPHDFCERPLATWNRVKAFAIKLNPEDCILIEFVLLKGYWNTRFRRDLQPMIRLGLNVSSAFCIFSNRSVQISVLLKWETTSSKSSKTGKEVFVPVKPSLCRQLPAI